jgi:hypothetical protein
MTRKRMRKRKKTKKRNGDKEDTRTKPVRKSRSPGRDFFIPTHEEKNEFSTLKP